MQTGLYIAFIAVSLGVLVFPGPSILLIVANSLQRGRRVGLYTVAGGLVAMAAQLVIALAVLTSLVESVAGSFLWVRWAGAAYLVYLGAQRWRGVPHSHVRGNRSRNYGSAVVEGFIVALTNPGTMLFFVAFFPQFLLSEQPVAAQLFLLAGTFLILTVIVDIAYALLAARVGESLDQPTRARDRNRLAGGLLIAAAAVLALVNV
jgi:threonine/homoserine/homoserine lactone efflux protein